MDRQPSDVRNRLARIRSRMRSATATAPSRPVSGRTGRTRRRRTGPRRRFPGRTADDGRRLDQRLAAGEVAVGVVDLLEAVEVEEQQRQRPAAARRRAWFRGAATRLR